MFRLKIFFLKLIHFAARATLILFCLLASVSENMNTIMSAPSILIIVSSKCNLALERENSRALNNVIGSAHAKVKRTND